MKKNKNKKLKKIINHQGGHQSAPKIAVSKKGVKEKNDVLVLAQNKLSYIPKVSIIMPVYNVAEYLHQCLDSMINQTLKDIEIICVDDGSTDNSLNILKEYARRDHRITLFSSSHIGTGKCRNLALSSAKGKYIGFVDPDDWVETSYFEKLYTAGESGNYDIVFQTKRIEINPSSGTQVVIGTTSAPNELAFRFNIIQESAHLWSKIFSRQFVEKYHLKNASTRRSQDLLFTIPALLLAHQIKCIEDAKYYYRKGHKSVCQANYTEKEIRDISEVYQKIYNILDQENPNLKSLVQLKENLFYKRNFPQLTKEEQKNLRNFVGEKYFTDFVTDETKPVICIKNPAPKTVGKLWWGDYWLGLDLAAALKKIGYEVRVDYQEEFSNRGQEFINIVIRGLHPCNDLDKSKINVLYLISCWDKVSTAELKNYDFILVCSLSKQKELQRKGLKAYYFPQFTNPARFFPVKDNKYNHKILFVGNAYDGVRPAVKYSVENKLPISVYGMFWEKKIDDSYIKGLYIDNNELHKYYSNADIVLNDTKDTMRQNGFVSNRIYDVTACKGFLISDYIPEIAKTYGDNIPMYKNAKELKKLIQYYLSHPEEREKKAEVAYRITMENYTNVKMAQTFRDIINTNGKINKIELYKTELMNWYAKHMHQPLNLDYPQTFNEKIQWLKLYDSTPIKTRLADKYLVRDWVKEKIGEKYLIPLLGVYDKFEDINFDNLPNQFVIKCNHGCGYNIIVKNKFKVNLADIKNKLDTWMTENFSFQSGCELHYKDITPKIIVEKFIENQGTNDLYDYKFWCFNGQVEYIQFLSERNLDGLKMAFYNKNWEKQNFVYSYPLDKKTVDRPTNLDLMIKLAEELSQGFPHVRVDFYRLNDGTIYFGEMTFTSASGICQWNNEKIDLHLGELIHLPTLAYNMDTQEYFKLKKNSWLKLLVRLPVNLCKLRIINKYLLKAYCKLIQEKLTLFRIDIKNFGNSSNSVEIYSKDAHVMTPAWFTNAEGKGYVLEGENTKINIKIKAIQNGKLRVDFKGIYKTINKIKLPLWIDYSSIKINDKEILSIPVSTWHDKPFRYEMPVKDGQVVHITIKQQAHKYLYAELEEMILKLFSGNKYIKKHMSLILKGLSSFVKAKEKKPFYLFKSMKSGFKTTVYLLGLKFEFKNRQEELLQIVHKNQQELLQIVTASTRENKKLEQQNFAFEQQLHAISRDLQQTKLWLKQTYEMFPSLNKQLANAQETLLSQLVTERKVNRLAAIVSMEIKRQRKHHKDIAGLLSKFVVRTQIDLQYLKNLDVVKNKQLHKTADMLIQHLVSAYNNQAKQLADIQQSLATSQETLQNIQEMDVSNIERIQHASNELINQINSVAEIQAKQLADIQQALAVVQKNLQEIKIIDADKKEYLQQSTQQLTAKITASVQAQERMLTSVSDFLSRQQENSLEKTTQILNFLETWKERAQRMQEEMKTRLLSLQNKNQRQYQELNFADLLHDSTQNSAWLKDKTLSLYGWAANYSFIYTLFRILDKVSPLHILEMGLGQTTRLTSQYIVYKNPSATLDICEHNQDWIDIYTMDLPKSSNIKVHHLELEYFDYVGQQNDKYKDLAQVVGDLKYDLIIVDGPVGGGKNFPRSNIIDLIPQNLAKDFIIIFDDAERPGEQNTISQIKAKLTAQKIAFGTQQRNALKSQILIFSQSCEFVQYL